MNIFGIAAIALVVIMAFTMYRVIVGPTIYDRFLGAVMSATTAVFVMGLTGFWFERPGLFVDLLLAYALLNFIAVVVAAKFLEQANKRKNTS